MSDERPEAFYDELAEDYHLIFAGWAVTERRTRYRALKRATLTAALRSAGFAEVTWPQTGWYQPVISARTSSQPTATGRTPR